ncbi:hypothetical protein HUU05_25850 [candidate division KSB1 bacterium]|nr:hypothetical protein [candidate division KSB1 bacterium]
MNDAKQIPDFKSYQEAAEFWDTHSLADYWDQTEPAEFEVANQVRRRYLVPVDRDLIGRVQQVARVRGVTTESLVNLLIEQRLREIEVVAAAQ